MKKEKIKNFLRTVEGKAFMVGTGVIGALSITKGVYAEDATISTITSSLVDALTSSKSDFITAVSGVVGVAVGYFIVKFIVNQVVNFFSTVAKK